MLGRFVIERTGDGGFRFALVLGNGQVVALSGRYRSKRAALDAIKSVKGNTPDAVIDDQTGEVA